MTPRHLGDADSLAPELEHLAALAAVGDRELVDLGSRTPPDVVPRRGAVLLLLAGESWEDMRLVVEERSHALRSQPGQFSLPGGGVEPADPDDEAAALREAQEEIGLDPAGVRVLGAFSPIDMPWRHYEVRPVLAWTPRRPALRAHPAEVERIVWVPLRGPDSLQDPSVRRRGVLDGHDVGVAYDLPGDVFIWGFTARILEAMLQLVEEVPPLTSQPTEIPDLRRREGARRHPGPAPGRD